MSDATGRAGLPSPRPVSEEASEDLFCPQYDSNSARGNHGVAEQGLCTSPGRGSSYADGHALVIGVSDPGMDGRGLVAAQPRRLPPASCVTRLTARFPMAHPGQATVRS
ncbi:hypothetical protein OOK36_54245 [Streptomyces sp. NBC_00365]|uniref:hypothetical protein n=1 Tax=Streptomyces sp. NBC_00365 TaxID=2975726 RepID=UPI00224D3DAA|nr:hypothetical protein [Streptomyces sp. NBC_00365]MCX5097444.1 hypothetical protein [Streptomyces sp. NBC_00365]